MTTNYILDYRPSLFSEVVGQDLIIQQLTNYLDSLRKNSNGAVKIQPLLLCGPPGTGKTTSARLTAYYLNCLEDNTADCKCNSCKQKVPFDFHEVDGGTANGVDAIGSIINISQGTPRNRFLIIFIDEAHRLSGAAKDKLLHQTEEPPDNVLYILGTTAENKIDSALLSRCKVKRFGLIPDDLITSNLLSIINLENNSLKTSPNCKEIVSIIVTLSKGSMRTALSKLGDVLNLDNPTPDTVKRAIGLIDYTTVVEIISSSLVKLGEGLGMSHKLKDNGGVPKIVLEQMGEVLTDLLNVKAGCPLIKLFDSTYYEKMFPSVSLAEAVNFKEVYLTGLLLGNTFSVLNLILANMYLSRSKQPEKIESTEIIKTSNTTPLNIKPTNNYSNGFTAPINGRNETNGSNGNNSLLNALTKNKPLIEVTPPKPIESKIPKPKVEEVLIDEGDLF